MSSVRAMQIALRIVEQGTLLSTMPPGVHDGTDTANLLAHVESARNVLVDTAAPSADDEFGHLGHQALRVVASYAVASLAEHVPPTDRAFLGCVRAWGEYLAGVSMPNDTDIEERLQAAAGRLEENRGDSLSDYDLAHTAPSERESLESRAEDDAAADADPAVEHAAEEAAAVDSAGAGADRSADDPDAQPAEVSADDRSVPADEPVEVPPAGHYDVDAHELRLKMSMLGELERVTPLAKCSDDGGACYAWVIQKSLAAIRRIGMDVIGDVDASISYSNAVLASTLARLHVDALYSSAAESLPLPGGSYREERVWDAFPLLSQEIQSRSGGYTDLTMPSYSDLRGDAAVRLADRLNPLRVAGVPGVRLCDRVAVTWDEHLAGQWPDTVEAVVEEASGTPPTERVLQPLLSDLPRLEVDLERAAELASNRIVAMLQVVVSDLPPTMHEE